MNRLSSRQRKLVYLCGILILLIPIIWLGRPGAAQDQGGRLAQLRTRYDLGENQLGKVDPTSAAMNLVLLGFRGIAADLIWINANDNEETKNWAELRANVDAIIMLQPHFVKVWQFQGWNLAYNVSAAWDLVADRYYWVKEGAKFLKQGCVVNGKVAQLPYEEGRIVGTKIGRADEWQFFRKYFKFKDPNEDLFKGRPDPELNPQGKDNYLAAKDLYLSANELQKKFPQSISMLEVLFRSYPYRSQLSYPDALQREGTFDEASRTGWQQAYQEWVNVFGQEKFDSPAGQYHLEMNDAEIVEQARAIDADLGDYRRWVIQMQSETRYPYWKTRALVEFAQIKDESNKEPCRMVDAHKLIYDGQQQFKKGNLSTAQDLLYRGMDKYQQLLGKYNVLSTDDESIEEAMTAVLYWQKIRKLQFQAIPDQYPLKGLWDKNPRFLSTIEGRFKRETGQD
jgi:hypothetical protein